MGALPEPSQKGGKLPPATNCNQQRALGQSRCPPSAQGCLQLNVEEHDALELPRVGMAESSASGHENITLKPERSRPRPNVQGA